MHMQRGVEYRTVAIGVNASAFVQMEEGSSFTILHTYIYPL